MTPNARAVAAIDEINKPLPWQISGKERTRIHWIIRDHIEAAVKNVELDNAQLRTRIREFCDRIERVLKGESDAPTG